MASSFSDLGLELMATGENAGTWGTKTNTNLQIIEKSIAGYVEQAVTSGGTTALSITDGDTTESTSVARHAVIKLTGTITGNSIVTVPDSIEKVYIVTNGTSGAYTVQFKTASGTGITFGVSEKTTRLVYSDGTNIVDAGFGGASDMEGRELVLDADGDTTITADTDDQIDIKIAGADDFQFTANTFTAQSGSTIAAQALTATTITASGIVKTDDTTEATSTTDGSLQTDGGLSVAKDAVFGDDVKLLSDSAVLNFGADSDVSLTHVADTALLLNAAMRLQFRDSGLYIGSNADGDLDIVSDGTAVDSINLESAGGITLDAGTAGSGIIYEDDGTEMARIHNSSSNVILETKVSDADFSIKGNDGGSTITALTFDMSDTGKATFSGDVVVTGDITVSGDDITMGTNTAGNLLVADGTNFNSIAAGDLSEISTVANDDVFIAVDTSGGGLKKIARSTIVAGLATSGAISNLVEDTSPQLGGNLDTNSANILIDDAHFIGDENGNEQIIFQTTSSAVNQFDVTNAATGNAPEISATGGDTNIDLKLTPKGSGQVIIDGNVGIDTGVIDLKNGGSQSVVRFYCESSNAHYAQIQAPAHSAFSGNVTLTLPASTDTLVGRATTDTLTNKTLTTPVIAEIDSGSTITLDATTDIVLDADGGDVFFKDGGTTIATLTNSSSDFVITTGVQDKDFVIKGDDGGSAITALTIDMSAAGAATFNDKIVATELDISGNVDIDGTLETDALSIASTTISATAAEINLVDGGATVGTTAVADGDGILHNDGGTMRVTSAATFKTYFTSGVSSAADDLTAGDAAVNLTTSSGNITIDAAANDSDIIFKGTDNSSDITMLTLDGSDAGSATFNDKVIVGDGKLVLNSTAVTSTAAELNLLDGVSGLVQADLTKLAAVDSTAAELNIVDGGTSATSTTVADADRVVLNDNGTMVQVAMTDIKTYIGGGTSWQAVKTSNYTASAGQGVFANTSGGAFTVTLPASPDLGDEVSIKDYAGTFDTNNLTVGRNSQPIEGVAADLTVSVERAGFTLVYSDSTQGWLLKDK